MPLPIVSPIRVVRRGGRHVFSCADGEYGSLSIEGGIGRFESPDAPPLLLRPEPGITAAHYQVWNEKDGKTSEFFASSYRWSIFDRVVRVHYGNNDYRLVPRPSFGTGYDLVDNRGKRILSMKPGSGGIEITVDKLETELACIVFTYFLAKRAWMRSVWPSKAVEEIGDRQKAQDAATKAAEKKAEELAQAMMPGGVKKAGVESSKEAAGSGKGK